MVIRKRQPEIGEKFHYLTVVRFAGYMYSCRSTAWICLCICGKECKVTNYSLIHNKVKSCGCKRMELIREGIKKHGLWRSPEYTVWDSMIQRCTNPNNRAYKNYGERGITVCERWKKFDNFFADMGQRPKGLTLDRIDNNKGYFPDNCRWATRQQQVLNTRRTRFIEIDGKMDTLFNWCTKYNAPFSERTRKRIKNGWDFFEAINLPRFERGKFRKR